MTRDISLEALASMIKQPSPWRRDSTASCRKCRGPVEYQIVNEDHEDELYRCLHCGHRWYVDGADA